MEEVDLPRAILTNEDRGFQPPERLHVRRRSCAADIFPRRPSDLTSESRVDRPYGPVQFHAASVRVLHEVDQLDAGITLAGVEGEEATSREMLKRSLVVPA